MRACFESFHDRQTEETYDFCQHIGLPTTELPSLAFFDTLNSPTQFVSVRMDADPTRSVVGRLREAMDALRVGCKWVDEKELANIRGQLAKEYPDAIRFGGVYRSIERTEYELQQIRKRLSRVVFGAPPSHLSEGNYQATYRSLSEILSKDVLPSLEDEKRHRTERVLTDLNAGGFQPNLIDHLRLLRQTHKRTLTESALEAFANFFRACDILFQADRLRDRASHLEMSLVQKRSQLITEAGEERERLRLRSVALESDIALSKAYPLTVLSELRNARLWKLKNSRTNYRWLLEANRADEPGVEAVEDRSVEGGSTNVRMKYTSRARLERTDVDVVLVVAVRLELQAVLAILKPLYGYSAILRIDDDADKKIYYLGRIGLANVVVTMCRMGSSSRGGSLITTYKSIASWSPRFVIMVGIAFGRDNQKQRLGDVIVSSIVHCYELQRRNADVVIYRGPSPESGEFLRELFENESDWSFQIDAEHKSRLLVGALLSGEKLVDDTEFKRSLFEAYPDAIGGEMEASGVYAAATTKGVEWIVVKGICDWADGFKNDDSQPIAARAAVSLVNSVLSKPLPGHN